MGMDSDVKEIPNTALFPTRLKPTRSNRIALVPALLLFAITILCNLPLLKNTPLAGTEGHRAITSEQMIREGNWILPKLFDRYYLAKPPMQYWLISLCHVVAGGGNGLVWRLPAIIAAGLLNATLCLFAGRWFGQTAAWVAGWSGFGLVALWGQVPSADVDSVDTFFAILAALVMVELLFGKTQHRIGWMLLAAVSTGAMLLTKGPAGLLPISGVLLWGAFASRRKSRSHSIRPPDQILNRWSATLAAFLIGIGIFGGYLWIAWWKMYHSALPPDFEGVQEGASRFVYGLHRFLQALGVPLLLFLFTLPTSLALVMLPLAGTYDVAGGISPDTETQQRFYNARRLANALAGGVVFSWLVALVTATENPRWVYTTLPLLCPLAGAVAAGGLRIPASRRGGTGVVFAVSILLYIAISAVFSFLFQREFSAEFRAAGFGWVVTALTAIGAVIACVDLSADRISRAGVMAAIALVLSTIPFTLFNRFDRARRSAINDAPQLLDIIGPHATIGAGRMVVSQPELLYYAGADVRHFVHGGPISSPGFVSGWIIAFPDELKAWRAQGTITDVHAIRSGKVDTAYVGWFIARK